MASAGRLAERSIVSETPYSGPEGALVFHAFQVIATLMTNTVFELSSRSGIAVDFAELRATAEHLVKGVTSTGLSYEEENAAINAGLAIIDDYFSKIEGRGVRK
jgi:hypothetical protein